ncbi:SDR family NAD(P)-dependent oxidoreductase [Microvirga puerhi]|uniref:SDR family oxidoreductase n=1 Tax=Microvirga puerhi TaxID=2876078 RepID=A0ABS7VT49_9HYPH|nr:SDR family oxidoreductase [Microvirga puerhi]MBZ6078726.1 SDR family oxidoreductase [Microvirga puerhi]
MEDPGQTWLNFSGKVCVVTGAGGGIGQAIAMSFARAGANIAILDHSPEGCAATDEAIRDAGGSAMSVVCDVSNPASIDDGMALVEQRFGVCDVLVNNAGILRFGKLDTVSEDVWDKTLDVNVKGYLLCAQRFGKRMRERREGAIVNVASIAATEPHPYCSSYSVSKAAVVMLTRQLALEWGPTGVRINAVSPGFTPTPLNREFYAVPGVTEQRSKLVPLRRLGSTQDVANSVMFLASHYAGYINGHNLVVDGGLSHTSMIHVPRPGYDDAN